MVDLALFNDWKYCSACGLPATPQEETNADDAASDAATSPPPRPRKKLMACADCGCVAYHNANCQRTHWRTGHRRECKTYASAVLPLKELIRWHKLHKRVKKADVAEEGTAGSDDLRAQRRVWCWWEADNENGITEETLHGSNRMWQQGAQLWHNKLYREAMQKFSGALEPYRRAWPYIGKSSGTNERREGDRNDFFERSFLLAKRLLFCAYCELDDRQFDSARQRLVQSLSITMTIFHSSPARALRESLRYVMNDAWMELMLSMEELPQHRIAARHVATMAIATKSCRWTDPLQRPGYMAHVPLSSTPHISRMGHPSWCRVLENNWIRILNEYNNLMENPLNFTNVGSGERGSGHDDHLVVSGRSWKEYVLFGTGAKQSDDDAPFTKQLLRDNVPDAISLAEAGGGEVIFSRLAPRTSIKPHCGPTNLRWTAHLGLVVPDSASDCQIRVKHAWHSWKLGKVLLFDDSYEHEVKNDTDEPRVVLLVRVWHPNLLQEQKGFFLSDAMAMKEDDVNKRYHPPM
ncbi:hypothetical protein ACHAXT_011214 [Thalassiosira profunda]